jgi:hypothetical protein
VEGEYSCATDIGNYAIEIIGSSRHCNETVEDSPSSLQRKHTSLSRAVHFFSCIIRSSLLLAIMNSWRTSDRFSAMMYLDCIFCVLVEYY